MTSKHPKDKFYAIPFTYLTTSFYYVRIVEREKIKEKEGEKKMIVDGGSRFVFTYECTYGTYVCMYIRALNDRARWRREIVGNDGTLFRSLNLHSRLIGANDFSFLDFFR